MWRLEVSAAVRHIYIYMLLGFKRLSITNMMQRYTILLLAATANVDEFHPR